MPTPTPTPGPSSPIDIITGYLFGGNPTATPLPPGATYGPTTAASGQGGASFSITLLIIAILAAIIIAGVVLFFISGKHRKPKKKVEELTPDYLYKMVTGEEANKALKPEQERIPLNNYKKKK